jgi:hypothetical protein
MNEELVKIKIQLKFHSSLSAHDLHKWQVKLKDSTVILCNNLSHQSSNIYPLSTVCQATWDVSVE